jgi:hypothetical protein
MISRKNWEASKKSYEALIEGLKRKTKNARTRAMEKYRFEDCGYCLEHHSGYCGLTTDCLFGEYSTCAEEYGGWRTMKAAYRANDIKTALLIAERIYQAILDDEVNVYEPTPEAEHTCNDCVYFVEEDGTCGLADEVKYVKHDDKACDDYTYDNFDEED